MGDLREQVAKIVAEFGGRGKSWTGAGLILALPEIAEKAEDQTIPTHLNPYPAGSAYHNIWNHAMETMYCQDFRKVKPKSYTCPERGEPVDFGLDCRCDRMQGATPLFTGCTKGLPSNWRDRMMKGTILPREEVRE